MNALDESRLTAIRNRAFAVSPFAPDEKDLDRLWLLGQLDLARADADAMASAAEALKAALFGGDAVTIELALERHREAVALRSAK